MCQFCTYDVFFYVYSYTQCIDMNLTKKLYKK